MAVVTVGNIHVVYRVFVGKLVGVVAELELMFVVSIWALVLPIENANVTTQGGSPTD